MLIHSCRCLVGDLFERAVENISVSVGIEINVLFNESEWTKKGFSA